MSLSPRPDKLIRIISSEYNNGLMTMAPRGLDLDERRNLFKECRSFADQLNLPDCSMGMSSDWKQALQSGSTWLRLGSTLFGDRPKYFNTHTDITKSN